MEKNIKPKKKKNTCKSLWVVNANKKNQCHQHHRTECQLTWRGDIGLIIANLASVKNENKWEKPQRKEEKMGKITEKRKDNSRWWRPKWQRRWKPNGDSGSGWESWLQGHRQKPPLQEAVDLTHLAAPACEHMDCRASDPHWIRLLSGRCVLLHRNALHPPWVLAWCRAPVLHAVCINSLNPCLWITSLPPLYGWGDWGTERPTRLPNIRINEWKSYMWWAEF